MQMLCISLYMYVAIALFAVLNVHYTPTLRCRVHIGTRKGRGNFSGFQGMLCGMFINYRTDVYDHLFICHTTDFWHHTEFINVVTTN